MANWRVPESEDKKMEDLLTSSEARQLLGDMSPSTFKTYVDNKTIRKITPPGRTQGKYVREDVEKVAKEVLPFKDARTSRKSSTDTAIQPFVDWIGVND